MSSADAERVVSHLDELALLALAGDGDVTGQWANDEGPWLTANMESLLGQGSPLSDYITNVLALLSAVSDGSDQTDAVATLLASRNVIAAAYGLTTVALPTPEPTAAPTPKPIPMAYAKLSSRAWAKIVKAPDNYTGKGYVLWACITQFDAATGPESFLGMASYRKEPYWYSDGENTWFTGNGDKLADFVEGDIVSMNVVSQGSYSYDTQAGGNTTVPSFEVKSIKRRGSCK